MKNVEKPVTSLSEKDSSSEDPTFTDLSVKLTVQYNEQTANLSLIIVKGNGQSLLGRDWLAQIRLDWQRIHSILKCGITEVLNRHSHVFQETLGTLQGYKA